MPQPPDLRGHQQSPLPLVQMREQHPEPHGTLITRFIRNADTTSTSPRSESNTLMIGRPLARPRGVSAQPDPGIQPHPRPSRVDRDRRADVCGVQMSRAACTSGRSGRMEPTSAPLRAPADRGRERGPHRGCCGRPAPGRTRRGPRAHRRRLPAEAPRRPGPPGPGKASSPTCCTRAERPGEVHAPDTRPQPRARGGSGVPDVTASYGPGSLPHQPP